MSRQCYQQLELSTESIEIDEIDPLPHEEKFAMLNDNNRIVQSYVQAINRMFVDIKTADIFSRIHSKQDTIPLSFSANLQKLYNPIIFDLYELNNVLDTLNYSFRNKNEIASYLLEFPELIPILREAPMVIKTYFKKASLVLELQTDPEDGSEILLLYIQTSLPVKEAYALLTKIDEIWWLEKSKKIGDLMCLHIEFQ